MLGLVVGFPNLTHKGQFNPFLPYTPWVFRVSPFPLSDLKTIPLRLTGMMDELHYLSAAGDAWTEVTVASSMPTHRWKAFSARDSQNRLWIFGGEAEVGEIQGVSGGEQAEGFERDIEMCRTHHEIKE